MPSEAEKTTNVKNESRPYPPPFVPRSKMEDNGDFSHPIGLKQVKVSERLELKESSSETDEDEDDELEQKRQRAKAERLSKKRASNTSNLRAAIRDSDERQPEGWTSKFGSSREFVLPMVVVLVLVILLFGMWKMMDGVLGTSAEVADQGEQTTVVPPAAGVTAETASEQDKSTFATPDHYLELSLKPDGTCSYSEGDKRMDLPYSKYELTPGAILGQAAASLMEKQRWFVKTKDGMKTDQDVTLYPLNSPDWQVITKMNDLYNTMQAWGKAQGGYPHHTEDVENNPEFAYVNPFTGKKEKMFFKGYADLRLGERLETQSLLGDEGGAFKPGEIRIYTVREVSNNRMVGGLFFIRGADSHGRFFRVRSVIENKVLLFAGSHGKDISNYVKITDRSTMVATKPTRIWMTSEGQPPAALIHHIVPIALAIFSFLLGGRSLLVRDVESISSPINRILRTIALIGLGLTVLCIIVQFAIFG